MTGPDTDLVDLFQDEVTQRLDQMDSVLLTAESGNAEAAAVDSLFRHAHTIKGAAGMLGFEHIQVLAHAFEDVLARVRGAAAFPPELAALLLRATAALRAMTAGTAEPDDDLLGELAASAAGGDSPDARGHAEGPGAPGPAQAAISRPADPPGRAAGSPHTLRVPAGKIDHLLDVAGEIMQYRSRLGHALGQEAQAFPDIAEMLSSGGRLLDDLRDTAVGMRTLPLSVITAALPRAVRDLARAAGKDVDFAMTGTETQIDRVILESLPEALTHLLRNAVAHGIEAPAERESAGKPRRGRIELRAAGRGSMVQIVVADDGRGACPEVIDAAGREGSLTDLLARPGYSTAPEVTEAAGRGVGLDAVRSQVSSAGGTLDIRSEPGRGMDVVLLLPLSLALAEVVLAQRGGAVFGIPLAATEEVISVGMSPTLQGRPSAEVRGQPVPVTDMAAALGADEPPPGGQAPGLVISAGGRRAVVTCDAVLGTEEVMVKSLGPVLAGLPGYTGAAILGDGRVVLLVDPSVLARAPALAAGTAVPGAAPAPAAPAKVLVVEDSFTVRELQRSIIEAAGYPVATARDGRDALDVLRGDRQIALVITDVEMPGLDGIELTRAIRADAARSSLPVVIVTLHGSEEVRRRAMDAGADEFMAKHSFDQQALLSCVERLLGR
jgi:two-component system chemotaxis sensor kinase CheA